MAEFNYNDFISSLLKQAPEDEVSAAKPSEVRDFIEARRAAADDEMKLADARAEEKVRANELNFGQAFGDLGAGMAGTKVDSSYYENQRVAGKDRIKSAESDLDRNRKSVQDFLTARRGDLNRDAAEKKQTEHEKFLAAEKEKDRELTRETNAANMALKRPKGTVGQEAADKEFGKHYDEYTSRGRNNAINAIAKLDALAKEMESDQGTFESGGGRIAAELPDWARSRDAIRRRDDTRNAANTTLKELFGGQLSDAERESAAKEYYNDALGNKENAAILRRKIGELKDNLNAQDAKASFYENNGTLVGYKGLTKPAGDTKTVGGKTYRKVSGGWEQVD